MVFCLGVTTKFNTSYYLVALTVWRLEPLEGSLEVWRLDSLLEPQLLVLEHAFAKCFP